jgi:hypothetical protein
MRRLKEGNRAAQIVRGGEAYPPPSGPGQSALHEANGVTVTDERQAAPAGYGAAIPYSEDIGYMWDISTPRLALEVLKAGYPWPHEASWDPGIIPAAIDALGKLDQRFRDKEIEHLRKCGITNQYLIIRPVSPINPPGPEDRDRITGAIATLIELGMIAGRGDCC